MVTRAWKVYGADGHRQKESFGQSRKYDWSNQEVGIRKIEILNSDRTGTNDFSIAIITCNSDQECEECLWGQISDGIFENNRVGKVEEITMQELRKQMNSNTAVTGYTNPPRL